MNTVTVKYNPSDRIVAGLIDVLSMMKGVQLKKDTHIVEKTSPYDPTFVEEILKSDRSKGIKVELEDLWKLS